MLQKVDMQIYVKTFNGNPNTDMSQVKDNFMNELKGKNMTYYPDAHYISQYRGHGPMFGRTMEIWVEKYKPVYKTVCHGGVQTTPKASTSSPIISTPTTPIPDGSNLISYY